MKVDRTYVKKKRIKRKLPIEPVFKRNDIAWALWIERDGSETINVKTRPVTKMDFKRSSKDFEETHEVISAFLVVVNADTTKKGTCVVRVDNQNDSILNRCNRSYLQNKYLHRYSVYPLVNILKAVYRSIERLMVRPDYQIYWDTVKRQKTLVDNYLKLKDECSPNTFPVAIEYLTIQSIQIRSKNISSKECCVYGKDKNERRSQKPPSDGDKDGQIINKKRNSTKAGTLNSQIRKSDIEIPEISLQNCSLGKVVNPSDEIENENQGKSSDYAGTPMKMINISCSLDDELQQEFPESSNVHLTSREGKTTIASNYFTELVNKDFKSKRKNGENRKKVIRPKQCLPRCKDEITKTVEKLTASIVKKPNLKRKKPNNRVYKQRRYEKALSGSISPPSDADNLDLDLTVDQNKFPSISQLSRQRLTERRNMEEHIPKENIPATVSKGCKYILKNKRCRVKENCNHIETEVAEGTQLSEKSKRKHQSLNKNLPLPNRTDKSKSLKNKKRSVDEAKRKLKFEHRQKHPVSNTEILKFLGKKETALYLKNIFNEEIASERHTIMCQMFKSGKLDFGIYSPIIKLAQVDFLEDDKKIDRQLTEKIEPIMRELDLSRVHGMAPSDDKLLDSQAKNNRDKYIYHVMVPEALVKYLQTKKGWDKKRAEQFFLDGESRVTDHELKEFDQELEEDARREKERKRKLVEQYDSTDESENYLSFDNEDEHLELPNLDDPEEIGGVHVIKPSNNQAKFVSTREKRRNRSGKESENGNW